MSWWGKVLGGTFGFMLGGPLGAAIGAAIGHNFDRGLEGVDRDNLEGASEEEQEKIQAAFFTATFSIMGYLSKSDGRVSEEEIGMARQVMANMNLNADMRRAAINLFNQGKSHHFPARDMVEQFRQMCGRRTNLVRMFMEIQLQAVYADGELHPAEEKALVQICQWLRFPVSSYRQLETMVRASIHAAGPQRSDQDKGSQYRRQKKSSKSTEGMTLQDAYDLLGVTSTSSNAEIKRAYRRLMSQHHPDKLVSKGLPEEMIKLATEKTHQIRQAYEKIKALKGF
ncbi:MAG TPA: co-chaperone DjlA [Gammaproteobacteria bacterium]|nr:co-chaperone DjlA [Gammaproteobacteria bacterium]